MGTITLSVPDKLKDEMDKTEFINWSAIARRAFAETLADVMKLELIKKVREISEISEISEDDKREVKESLVNEVIESTGNTSRELKSGKKKSLSLEEFNKWCG